jgi:FkbM family methyltransferase
MPASLTRRLTLALARALFLERTTLNVERLGTAYGGWVVPVGLVQPGWVVYSAGVGEDISFDLELIKRCGCEVHAFDPTPRARRYVETLAGVPDGFHFHAYGLWCEDGTVRFYGPRDPAHVSHSITNLQQTETFFEGPVKTLQSAMVECGHERLDLLKMDIEGAEYAVIREMIRSGVQPRVICVELERHGPWPNVSLLVRLRRQGYALVCVDGRNVTLVARDLVNHVKAAGQSSR